MIDILSYKLGQKSGGGSGGGGGGGGGGSASVSEKDVNYYDYDGTVLYSYTAAEALALTEEPALPERSGLICQGWNVSLEDMKSYVSDYGKRDVGATYITDDGKTRLYIHLEEGRTSPMVGVCPNGTVTVDWGDGSTPDVLTGTSTSAVKWTPNHEYAAAGEYVISLTVDGTMGIMGANSSNNYEYILRYSPTADVLNHLYQNALIKVEIGSGVTIIGDYAFTRCYHLMSITIPKGITRCGDNAFEYCYNLTSVTFPDSTTRLGSLMFQQCHRLRSAILPDSITVVSGSIFISCVGLPSVTLPKGLNGLSNSMFKSCSNLTNVTIPNSITSLGDYVFESCTRLLSIILPDSITTSRNRTFGYCYGLTSVILSNSLTVIAGYMFTSCYGLTRIIIPNSVTQVLGNAFENCAGIKVYDFTNHISIPTLGNTNAFYNISADCEIRVPAALADEWKAATNWSTYADKIVGV